MGHGHEEADEERMEKYRSGCEWKQEKREGEGGGQKQFCLLLVLSSQ